jgi:adenylosuccinate synthase
VLTVVIGALYGDEGKGRVVQALARGHAVVARATGGANASHTVFWKGRKITLRQVPCGVFSRAWCCTGDGMALDPIALVGELAMLASHGVSIDRVRVAERAVVVTPLHQAAERAREERSLEDDDGALGSTRQGVGHAMVDKVMRTALRLRDLDDTRAIRRSFDATLALFPHLRVTPRALTKMARELKDAKASLGARVVDTREIVHGALARGRRVLVEGAQGTLLDVDHGAWPFVTSTHPTTAGALASLGVAPQQVERVVGVARVYATRQARGAFVTEVPTSQERWFRHVTQEHVLRVGFLDAVALRYAARMNGFTELVLTCVDRVVGFDALPLATHYLDAHGAAHRAWPWPERAPASVRYARVRPDPGATSARVGPKTTSHQAVRAWEPFLSRVAREVGIPVSRVSASPAGPLVSRKRT